MEVIGSIAATVLPVFAIIGIGFVYGRYKRLPAAELSDLLLWVLIPCLVLGSIGSKPLSLEELGRIGLAALVVVAGCGLVTLVVFARSGLRRAALMVTMFMNSANMAFPLAYLAFGDAGLSRQLIFYIAINLTHATVGIAIARGRGGLSEVFRLPLIYAAALAIGLAASGISLPRQVAGPLDLVGKATIPVMLILLGVRLRGTRLSHLGPPSWPAPSAWWPGSGSGCWRSGCWI